MESDRTREMVRVYSTCRRKPGRNRQAVPGPPSTLVWGFPGLVRQDREKRWNMRGNLMQCAIPAYVAGYSPGLFYTCHDSSPSLLLRH